MDETLDAARGSAKLDYKPAAREDEWLHNPTAASRALWLDNWWFLIRDFDNGITFGCHVVIPAAEPRIGRAAVLVNDGRRERLEVTHASVETSEETLSVGPATLGLTATPWDDRKRVKLCGQFADVVFELDVRGRFQAVDFHQVFPEFLPPAYRDDGQPTPPPIQHVEHAVTFTGWLQWSEGERVDVSGHGVRDRSWGCRRTDEMIFAGGESMFVHLPDSVCGLWAHHENSDPYAQHVTPVAAFIADAEGVHPCTGGHFLRDITGRPAELLLESPGIRSVHLSARRQCDTTFLPFHDPAPDGPGWMVNSADHWVEFADDRGGVCRGVASISVPFERNVLAHARFFGAG